MAIEVVMPRLGWNMEVGSLVEWVKRDGDRVAPGDVVCMVQSDKAIQEVETLDGGVLRIPPDSPALGAEVPVGTVLAYLLRPGEPAPFERPAATARASEAAAEPPNGATASAPPHPTSLAASVRQSREGATEAAGAADGRRVARGPRISPRARRVAADLGVDWTSLTGSGRTGRIRERDVRQALAQASAPPDQDLADKRIPDRTPAAEAPRPVAEPPRPPVTPARPTDDAAVQGVPLSGVRRLIAQRMADSAHTAAPVTLTTEADATELARLREQIKADLAGSDAAVPTYNDLFARLVALALQEHPALNASLIGGEIVRHETVNVGLAVDAERGLLVPVIRDVPRKSLQQIAAEAARLIEAARAGKIRPDDLQGGTFTISNLGMYDVDAFTPIVNLPECAILGVGRIVKRPVVIDDATEQVAVRRMLTLSLTFDHRLVDGGPAARFLQRVKQFVERPTLWLIR